MNPIAAVKAFFGKDARPIEMKEMAEFWKSLSPSEKVEIPSACAKALGVELMSQGVAA